MAPVAVAVVEVGVVDAVLPAKGLQLAFAGADAGEAVAVMVGKQQLQIHLAVVGDQRTVGDDIHAVRSREYAGRSEFRGIVDLDKAHAAGADGVIHIFQIAECRNGNAGQFGSLENRGAFWRCDFDTVNCQSNGFIFSHGS